MPVRFLPMPGFRGSPGATAWTDFQNFFATRRTLISTRPPRKMVHVWRAWRELFAIKVNLGANWWWKLAKISPACLGGCSDVKTYNWPSVARVETQWVVVVPFTCVTCTLRYGRLKEAKLGLVWSVYSMVASFEEIGEDFWEILKERVSCDIELKSRKKIGVIGCVWAELREEKCKKGWNLGKSVFCLPYVFG